MKKEELKELGVSNWDKLYAAVEKGDKSETLHMVDEIKTKTRMMIDTAFDFVDALLVRIAERLGEEEILPATVAMIKGRRQNWEGVGTEKFSTDAEERLKVLANILTTGHNINIDIGEDEEKYTVKVPCDTGGRLITQENTGKTKKAYPWSHSEQDFGYYCAHCVIGPEIGHIENYGYPAWTVSPPKKPGNPCILTIYKDPKFVPEEYYKSLGMDKDKVSK